MRGGSCVVRLAVPPRLASDILYSMIDTQDSDESLMLRYQRGDARAFEALYTRHRGPVFRYFVRQLGDAGVAEELYQETWIRVIGASDRYTRSARFKTWLYRIAHNLMVDHVRRREVRRHEDPLDVDSCNTPVAARVAEGRLPDREVEARSRVMRLLALVEALPRAQREAFLLHEEAGMTAAEIADATGVTHEAAKSRLRYAIAALREGMQS